MSSVACPSCEIPHIQDALQSAPTPPDGQTHDPKALPNAHFANIVQIYRTPLFLRRLGLKQDLRHAASVSSLKGCCLRSQ